ncbi:MAG: tRNA (adenosine(37)-N6)-dimethylallyltransferase MiaA [Sediminibacterium sp.]|jgi:tRNA dimethylallyltransferase
MSELAQNTILVICGPTAVGKTVVAIALAKALHTEIISADSRQCFKELGIAVAKPTKEELLEIPHHFIDSHSIHQELNAGIFETFALEKGNEIFKKQPIAVMVGGTGLYIKSFCEGMDDMPSIDPAIRQNIIELYAQNGLNWLQESVQKNDPVFWQIAEQNNPQRLMRALEIWQATGKSIIEFRTANKKQRPFRIIKIGLEMPRDLLNERINQRIDLMVEAGLVQEALALFPHCQNNALQTVGYQELFEYFNKKISLEKAIEQIKINTRHYAKRQMTWFKKDSSIHWFDATNASVEKMLELLK